MITPSPRVHAAGQRWRCGVGLTAARDKQRRRGRGWGFTFTIEEERKRVPQPLLTSLFLRDTWLLPGDVGNMTEDLRAGFGGSRSGAEEQKRGDATDRRSDNRP